MDGTSTPRDASEADVVEQHEPVAPGDEDEDDEETIPVDSIRPDVPEADAIEQAQTVPADEDDEVDG